MSQESIRTLEQLRVRLNGLATSLGQVRRDLEVNDPLPSWPSIQNSANILSHNLSQLYHTLANAQPYLDSAHAYPLPSFPGRTQEDLLGQLLRKKLQPQVEDWIEEGTHHAASFTDSADKVQTNGTLTDADIALQPVGLSSAQLDELWNWAGPEGNKVAREFGEDAFDDVFTLQEHEDGIENVVTGLRRKLWESDDEDEDEEGDKAEKMEVDIQERDPSEVVKRMQRKGVDESRPAMPLETILRFVSTGQEPSSMSGGPIRR